jgi:hypothetical protein
MSAVEFVFFIKVVPHQTVAIAGFETLTSIIFVKNGQVEI